ncbi:MAG: DUF4019 domain-containing protein [Pedobacter sp.]|nr:MAG: DUF4019 domain-containing protein [Pedobacter sp.]
MLRRERPENAGEAAGPVIAQAAPAGGSADKDESLVGEVEGWLKKLDHNLPDAYTSLAKIASTKVTIQQWEAAMALVRNPLGSLVSRKYAASEAMKEVPGMPGVEGMIYQFSSEYMEKKEAVETVILIKEGGRWKPAGYYIK